MFIICVVVYKMKLCSHSTSNTAMRYMLVECGPKQTHGNPTELTCHVCECSGNASNPLPARNQFSFFDILFVDASLFYKTRNHWGRERTLTMAILPQARPIATRIGNKCPMQGHAHFDCDNYGHLHPRKQFRVCAHIYFLAYQFLQMYCAESSCVCRGL